VAPIAPVANVAAHVPVKGPVPVANEDPPAEETVVLMKLSELPPCWLKKFIVLPFGAVRFSAKSPSYVIVILKLMVTLLIVEPEGMLLTFRLVKLPVVLTSGIITLIVPDDTVAVPVNVPVAFNAAAVPLQIVDGVALTVGVGGNWLTVTCLIA
jgi:hypothetical protein